MTKKIQPIDESILASFKRPCGSLDMDAKLPDDPDTTIGHLPNGLKYYVRHNKKPVGQVELKLVVAVGSVHEEEHERGIAHLVEHLCFRKTQDFKQFEIVKFLEQIGSAFGADQNAYTSFDETVYELSVPAPHLTLALKVLANWAGKVVFEEKGVIEENKVVLEELRSRMKNASGRISDVTHKFRMEGSRYADRMPIGLEPLVANFTAREAEAFYRKWYKPERMALIVVGDFDGDVLPVIQEQFKTIARGSGPLANPKWPLKHTEGVRCLECRDPEQDHSYASLLFKRERVLGDKLDYARIELMESVFCQCLNLRLVRLSELPEPPFLGAKINIGDLTKQQDGLTLNVSTEKGRTLEGTRAVLRELERVQLYGFTNKELEVVKIELYASLATNLAEKDDVESTDHSTGYCYDFLDGVPSSSTEFVCALESCLLRSLTLEDLQNFFEKNDFSYDVDFAGITVCTSESESESESKSEQSGGSEASANKNENESEVQVHDKLVARPNPAMVEVVEQVRTEAREGKIEPHVGVKARESLLEGITVPPPGTITSITPIESVGGSACEFVLSNGVRVALKTTDFQADTVSFTGMNLGGVSSLQKEEYSSARCMSTIASECGLGPHKPEQLREILAGHVASIEYGIGKYRSYASGECALNDLECMFHLLFLLFTCPPEFKVEVFTRLMSQWLTRVEQMYNNPVNQFHEKHTKAITQNHYFWQSWNKEILDKVDLATVEKLYKQFFSSVNGWCFVFVGNVKPERLQGFLEKYLACLPTSMKDVSIPNAIEFSLPMGITTLPFAAGKDDKANVIVTFPVTASNKQLYELSFLASNLNKRLVDVLRLQKQGIYSASVVYSAQPFYNEKGGTMEISYDCDPKRVNEMLEITLKECADVFRNGPNEEEIGAEKENIRNRRRQDLKRNSFWHNKLVFWYEAKLWNSEDKDEYLEKSIAGYIPRIDALTQKQLREEARRMLRLDNYFVSILLPKPQPVDGKSEPLSIWLPSASFKYLGPDEDKNDKKKPLPKHWLFAAAVVSIFGWHLFRRSPL